MTAGLHLRRVSGEEAAFEDADRARKIRAARIRRNGETWRVFVTRGLVAAWEYVHGPMPTPDFELEPSRFREWLGLDEPTGRLTTLETQCRAKLEQEACRAWQKQPNGDA